VATRTLTHQAFVAGVTPIEAIDWLADLSHTVGLQPLIESATLIGHEVVDGRETTSWRVAERPRLGPLGYRIRFGANVFRPAPDRLETRVRAAAGTRLTTLVHAVPDPTRGGVHIEQRLTATAPRLTIGYVTGQADAAHTEAFRRLPGLLGR
jgi:hypothetical protein